MIKLKINDKEVEVEEGSTILDASKKAEIKIPTLCFLKGINENASCRMCLVEVKGIPKLLTSCTTKVTEGMEVFTETEKIINARKQNLELILSSHNKDCDNCTKNIDCKLRELLNKYDIEESKYKKTEKDFDMDLSTLYLVRDPNKCILCGRCVSVCNEIQSVGVIGKNNRGINTHIGCAFEKELVDVPCIACGQCTLVCPTGALIEKDDIDIVEKALNNPELHVVVAPAPSVRVALGEEFGFPFGTNVKGKMATALRQLGFKKAFDVNFAADLTIMEEVNELIDRVQNGGKLPMFTSCSPGWIKYIEHYFPEMLDNVSSCKSPQQMLGAIIKSYYAEKNNIDPKNIFVVTIMPCIAKKFEKARDNENASGYPDIDAVLTTRELARFLKQKKIHLEDLEDSEFDNPLGSGASVIFGNSGGVMEAALRTFVETVTNKKLDNIDFTDVRGLDGVKEASYNVNGNTVKVAVVSGIKNAKELLTRIKNKEADYAFVEIMTCPGGCINGGGQPYIDYTKYDWKDVKKLRTSAILENDKNQKVRKAHENPDIQDLYKNYLGKPGSEKAHHILHTKYSKRDKYN